MHSESTPAVRCPWPIGTIVYHRLEPRRTPGITTGWVLRTHGLFAAVLWAPHGDESQHLVVELTTDMDGVVVEASEPEPRYSASFLDN